MTVVQKVLAAKRYDALPELRLFATYATWSRNFGLAHTWSNVYGTASQPLRTSQSHGFAFGAMFEIFF